MSILLQPYVQLLIFIVVLAFVLIVNRFDEGDVGFYGIGALLVWALVSLISGLPPTVLWSYYFVLALCLNVGWALVLGAAFMCAKYKGDGKRNIGSILVAPLWSFPLMFVPLVAVKILWGVWE